MVRRGLLNFDPSQYLEQTQHKQEEMATFAPVAEQEILSHQIQKTASLRLATF